MAFITGIRWCSGFSMGNGSSFCRGISVMVRLPPWLKSAIRGRLRADLVVVPHHGFFFGSKVFAEASLCRGCSGLLHCGLPRPSHAKCREFRPCNFSPLLYAGVCDCLARREVVAVSDGTDLQVTTALLRFRQKLGAVEQGHKGRFWRLLASCLVRPEFNVGGFRRSRAIAKRQVGDETNGPWTADRGLGRPGTWDGR